VTGATHRNREAQNWLAERLTNNPYLQREKHKKKRGAYHPKSRLVCTGRFQVFHLVGLVKLLDSSKDNFATGPPGEEKGTKNSTTFMKVRGKD